MDKDLDKLSNVPEVTTSDNKKDNEDNGDEFFKMDDGFRSLQGILEESITIEQIKKERLGL